MPGSSRPRRAPATVRGYYCARARSARIVRDSPSRALQKRVVAYPRHELPAAMRASGDIFAADFEPRTAHVVVMIGVKAAVGKKLISVGKKLLGE